MSYVRVRDTSGHELSIRSDLPEGHPRGIKPEHVVLDKPATTISGEPLPPKHRTDLGTPIPGGAVERKRRARKAAAPKPRKTAATKPVPTADPAPDNNDGQQADSEQEI